MLAAKSMGGPGAHLRMFGVSQEAVKRNRLPVKNRMSHPVIALREYSETEATQKITITAQTTGQKATLMQSSTHLPTRAPVNPRSITARILLKKANEQDRVSIGENISSYMQSPGNGSRHHEYSSHNATTLTMGKAPDAKRFNSVAQLRTERGAERGEIDVPLRPDFATV